MTLKETITLSKALPPEFSYCGICHCGEIVNKIEQEFGIHQYCETVAAHSLLQQQLIDIPTADTTSDWQQVESSSNGNKSEDEDSLPSATASAPTQTRKTSDATASPATLTLQHFKRGNKTAMHFHCPFDKSCLFEDTITAPTLVKAVLHAKTSIAKHLETDHAITNPQFNQ